MWTLKKWDGIYTHKPLWIFSFGLIIVRTSGGFLVSSYLVSNCWIKMMLCFLFPKPSWLRSKRPQSAIPLEGGAKRNFKWNQHYTAARNPGEACGPTYMSHHRWRPPHWPPIRWGKRDQTIFCIEPSYGFQQGSQLRAVTPLCYHCGKSCSTNNRKSGSLALGIQRSLGTRMKSFLEAAMWVE